MRSQLGHLILVTLLCVFSVFIRLLSHLADVHTHSVAGMFVLYDI